LTFVGKAGVGLRAMQHAGLSGGRGGHGDEDDPKGSDRVLGEGLEHGDSPRDLRGLSSLSGHCEDPIRSRFELSVSRFSSVSIALLAGS
jgi:hypothetical protein